MESRDGALHFQPSLELSKLRQDVAKMKQQITGVSRHAAKESNFINKSLTNVLRYGAGYLTFRGAQRFIGDIVAIRGEFQQLEVAFETMLQSKEKANAMMREVVDFAAKTPFQLTEVAGGTKQLLAYRIEQEKIIPTLKALGDVSAGLSVPIGRLILNYGQVKTAAKLTGRELRDFNMAGVPLIAELAKNLGKSEKEIGDMVSAGKIGFKEVEQAFKTMTSEGGRFADLMDKQSGTITGRISNLRDNLDKMMNDIGQANEGIINDAISGVGYLVENYEEVGRIIAELIAIYGSYKAALITISAIDKARIAYMKIYNHELKYQTWLAMTSEKVSRKKARAMALEAMSHKRLTKALIRQRIAQIRANLATMANPYVVVAAAVTALAYGIYKLATAQSSAEMATERMNQRIKEQKEWAEKERSEVRELIDTIKDEVSTRTDRQQALDTLQQKYPSIFQNMDTEAIKTVNLTDLSKKLNEELEKRNRLSDEAQITVNEKEIKELQKIASETVVSVGMGATSTGNIAIENKIEKLKLDNENLYKKIAEYDRAKAKAAFNALSTEEKKAKKIQENLALEKQRLEVKKEIAELEKAGLPKEHKKQEEQSIINQIKANEKLIDSYKEVVRNNTNAYKVKAKAEEDIAEHRANIETLKKNANLSAAERAAAIKKENEAIKEQQDLIKNQGFSLDKKTPRKSNKEDAKIARDFANDLRNNAKERKRLTQDLEFEVRQAEIDAKKEGIDKILEQNKLNYDRETAQIERQKADRLAKINDWERTEWEAKHPNHKEQGLKYIDRILLPKEEDVQFSRMEVNASIRFNALNEKAYNDELDRQADFVRTYLQKAQDFENRKKELQKQGYSESIIVKLAEIEQTGLAHLDEEMGVREEMITKLVDDLVGMGVEDVLAKLKEADQLLTTELQKGGTDKQQIRALQSKLKAYEAALQQKTKTATSLPNKAEWKDSVDIMMKIDNATQRAINGFEGLSDEVRNVLGALSTVSSVSIGVISTISEVAENAGTSMNLSAIMASESISKVEKASVILAIISAAMQVAQKIMSIISGNKKKHREALERIRQEEIAEQKEYNNLLWERNMLMEDAESIFGVDALSKALGYLVAYNQAFSNLQDKLKKKYTQRGYFGGLFSIKSFKSELDEIEVVTGHRKGGLFRHGKDYYTSITKLHKDLITKEGELNVEKAKSILRTQKMRDRDKLKLEEIIQLYEQQKEAQKEFNSYLKDTFGELGEGLMDSVINSLKTGEDAFESFAKNVGNVIGKLGKQLMYELFLSSKFKMLQNDIRKLYERGAKKELSKESIAKQVRGLVASFSNNIKGDISLMKKFAETWQKETKNLGFDVWSAEEEKGKETRQASRKSFAAMSQDMGASLDSRFALMTELQNQSVEILKNIQGSVKFLQDNAAKQLKHLAGIETNTGHLGEMKTDIASMRSDISDFQTKGIKIRR